jgi:hypothetical protein
MWSMVNPVIAVPSLAPAIIVIFLARAPAVSGDCRHVCVSGHVAAPRGTGGRN